MGVPTTIRGIQGLITALVLCLLLWQNGFALEVPPLTARVNDYADMLSPATQRQLENSLAAFEEAESTQVAVLTIPTLKGETIEEFSIRVADQWKIGQKGLDNGAILLIAKKDRKLRIEVGYGLEGKLTDLIAGRIIREIIVPQFRAGNFDQGVINGVNAIMEAVKGEFKAPVKTTRPSGKLAFGPSLLFMLIIYGFLIINLGRASRWLGTVAGGVLLPIFGSLSLTASLLFLAALVPVGFVLGFLLSLIGSNMKTSTLGHRRSAPGVFWGGSGGGFSSGGFGGFSGGGGGFGGGGASGGW